MTISSVIASILTMCSATEYGSNASLPGYDYHNQLLFDQKSPFVRNQRHW